MAKADLILQRSTTGVGDAFPLGNNGGLSPTIQAVTKSGTGGATIAVEVSNNGGVNWTSLGNITVAASAGATTVYTIPACYQLVRANMTAVGVTTSIECWLVK